MIDLNITNEYGKLKTVVVSSAEYYNPLALEENNETIKYYLKNKQLPTKEDLVSEQQLFWNEMKKKNINLLIAKQVDNVQGQIFTRDLAFVIGNKFFISNMKKDNRKKAINGWDYIIKQINQKQIIKVPKNFYLEGGDIVVDGKTVFVGLGERTTKEAIEFLETTLGEEYKVIPLKLKPKFLHLDVVFTIINPSLALIYKDGLEEESYNLLKNYKQIHITKQEQFELATNVFVISEDTIIINSKHKRIKKELEKLKFKVIPLKLSETAKNGGAFRCTTCPLYRE